MAKVLKKASSKKKAKTKSGHNQQSHDKRDRAVAIREAIRGFQQIEKDRDALNDRAKILTNMVVKGELGMSKKNFMLAFGQAFLEPEERAEVLGCIREVYAALKVGDQIDFLKVAEEADRAVVAARPEPITVEPAKAYEAGFEAGKNLKSRQDNPYDKGRHGLVFKKWVDGHHDGLLETLTSSGTQAAQAAAE